MFYVYLVIGFVIFGAGLIVTPGWWKLAWVAATFLAMMFLPLLLGKVLDPLNTKRIRSYCKHAGFTDVEIQPFPNHYGVHFRQNNKKHYAKCKVVRGNVEWKGTLPGEEP